MSGNKLFIYVFGRDFHIFHAVLGAPYPEEGLIALTLYFPSL